VLFVRSEHTKAGRSVCLITALTVADFIDPDLIVGAHSNTGAQLGVLTLASLLRRQGVDVSVVDLDSLFLDFVRHDGSRPSVRGGLASEESTADAGVGSSLFFPFLAAHLRALPLDIVGLSSICSSYPLTLRLAGEIKQLNPRSVVILGGPQASVVDVATLREFPSVDAIVRGEADDTFPRLVELIESRDDRWGALPGLTFRRGGGIVRNPNSAVVEDLDRLPLPAFDLDSRIRSRGGIHLEIGRGCPFACSFCSTNDFFRRSFRLKSPAKMIADITAIKQEYGVSYFSLVHDMYTIDRKKVVEFCEAIQASGEQFTWGCSARTDCIDDGLLELMAKAGCTGIFFGIETGSARLQQVINKKLDLAEAWKRIAGADRNGIHTTVALIVGFPEETRDDLRDTIHFFIDALRFDRAEPQCSLLAPLAATPVYEQHKHHLVFDDIFSDMSHQSWQQDPVEAEMIRAHPSIFPNFYAIPTTELDRRYVKDVMDFVTYLATWFRWLPVAILQDSNDLLRVFDRWQRWRRERLPRVTDEDTGWTPYYSHRRFHAEFLEFVRGCYLEEMATARAAVAAAASAECVPVRDPRTPVVKPVACLDESSVPYPLDTAVVVDIEVDYKELIDSLRHKTPLETVAVGNTTIVFGATGDRLDTWQLPPLSATLFRLCDGNRTVAEIVGLFGSGEHDIDGIPSDTVCLFGLNQLKEDGLIGLSAAPLRWEEPIADEPTVTVAPHYSPPPKATHTQQPWPASVSPG
jgi:radical SAM superfamily enzyme YgiQ (UPF0313 family)